MDGSLGSGGLCWMILYQPGHRSPAPVGRGVASMGIPGSWIRQKAYPSSSSRTLRSPEWSVPSPMRSGTPSTAGTRQCDLGRGQSSRHDLNGGLACRQFPQFLQILVGESNTPVGPVTSFVIGDRLGRAIGLSVDEDIPARGSVQRRGSFQVLGTGIGDVKRLEVVAVFQAKVDNVAAFRSAKIPLMFFRARWTQAERNAITAQRVVIMQQVEFPFVFDDENRIGSLRGNDRISGARPMND